MERIAYDRMRELEDAHWWFKGRRHILSGVIDELPLRSDARILEVGCGPGGNLGMLGRFGRVTPMEPDAACRDYIKAKFGLEALAGALPDDVAADEQAFDLVCAFDVVEHLDDDRASLARLRTLVRPDGFLIATVPAYQWMWSHHDSVHHHRRRYTRKRFEALVREAGCEIVRSTYFNSALFPPAAIVRLAKKVLRSEAEDDRLPSARVNGLLETIFASESRWLKRGSLPFGLSILVVARPAGTLN